MSKQKEKEKGSRVQYECGECGFQTRRHKDEPAPRNCPGCGKIILNPEPTEVK